MANSNQPNNGEGRPKTKLQGAIAALGDAVFTVGEKDSLNRFEGVRRKIAVHSGTSIHRRMYNLMLHEVEATFKPANKPTPLPNTRSTTEKADDPQPIPRYDPLDMDNWKTDRDAFNKNTEDYKKEKGRCFIMILGQCTTDLINKLEAKKDDYRKLLESDDVVGLLHMIEGFVKSPTNKEYEVETMIKALLRYLNMVQDVEDDFTTYKEKINTAFDVVTTHWGELAPTKLPNGVSKKEDFIEMLKAYILLKGARRENYGHLKKTLASNYATESGSYPVTFDNMAILLEQSYVPGKPFRPPNHNKPRKEDSEAEINLGQVEQQQQQQQQQSEEETSTTGPQRRSATPKGKKVKIGSPFRSGLGF